MTWICGVDVGGTKCAVSIGKVEAGNINLVNKRIFQTSTPTKTISMFIEELETLLKEHHITDNLGGIGVSCGSPLDSRRGLILSPPNLPGWGEIDIITPFKDRFGVPVGLQNDANACALAEWKWGAGKGTRNMIFLTFGTGMGAGLILDGKLYTGANDFAGEVGHIRLDEQGPIGYGKSGSFEGFCSGGGIAKLGQNMVRDWIEDGNKPSFCKSLDDVHLITAKCIGEAAQAGDPLGIEIFRVVAKQLGRGLAILVDILNPERIIIGSIYGRQRSILEPIVMETLKKEALSQSLSVCQVVPAGLGEQVGDFAGLSVAHSVTEQALR